MTRESEKLKIRMSVIVDGKHIDSLKKADEVIDKIFDEHEAQLKAKEEEIERLRAECEYDQRNASMSQKESVQHLEEIERLKEDVELLKNMANGAMQGAIISHNIANKKARSIVAMLFWKMKRQKKVFQKYYEAYGHNNSLTNCYRGMFEQALMDFNKSRKMLKDNA